MAAVEKTQSAEMVDLHYLNWAGYQPFPIRSLVAPTLPVDLYNVMKQSIETEINIRKKANTETSVGAEETL